ncbi:UNVERIFIED_CONTAM: hypothetical protein Sradi_6967600 [Sesamum radiatum]|uniref:Uncharacterized protein n=1 Tax=Sesamum radiatum TaxID=300843 RepID=A0AAW2JEX7_SESRA
MSSRRARTFGSQALDSSKRGNSWRPRDWPDPISADKEGLVTRLLESIAEFKLGRPSSSSDFRFWPVWTSVTKNNGIDGKSLPFLSYLCSLPMTCLHTVILGLNKRSDRGHAFWIQELGFSLSLS